MTLSSLMKNPRTKIKMIRKLRMFQPSWGVGWASPSGVCQAQPMETSWVCLPHPPRMRGSMFFSQQGQSSAIHCCYSFCCPQNMPPNRHALAVSYMCQQPSALRDTQRVIAHTYKLVPKLSTPLASAWLKMGLALQLSDKRVFGCSSLCVTHTLINNKRKINTNKNIKDDCFSSQFRGELALTV